MVAYIEPQYYKDPDAGSFDSKTGKFKPTEDAQKILNEVKDSTGLSLKVSPIGPYGTRTYSPNASGLYDASGFQGHINPFQREIFLRNKGDAPNLFYGVEKGGLHTLAHEAIHATDPDLRGEGISGTLLQGVDTFTKNIPIVGGVTNKVFRKAGDFIGSREWKDAVKNTEAEDLLGKFYELSMKRPNKVFKAELKAEIGAKKILDKLGIEYDEKTLRPIDEYPSSYIDKSRHNFMKDRVLGGIPAAPGVNISESTGLYNKLPRSFMVGETADNLNHLKGIDGSYFGEAHAGANYDLTDLYLNRYMDIMWQPSLRKAITEENKENLALIEELNKDEYPTIKRRFGW